MPDPFDPTSYGLPPADPLDPFGPGAMPPESAAPWSWVPPEWLDEPPAAPTPDPLGLTPSARQGAEAALAAAPAIGPQPRPAPAGDPLAAALGAEPSVQWPEWLGGPPQLVQDAQSLAAHDAAAAGAPTPTPGAEDLALGPDGTPHPLAGRPERGLPERREYSSVFDVLAIPDEKAQEQILAELPEEQFAAFRREHDQGRANLVEAQRVRAGTDAKRAAEDDAKAYEASLRARQAEAERLAADLQRLKGSRLDDDHWFSSGGVGRTLGAFVIAIIGGLLQHKTGGRNLGMEWIDKETERDLEVQKANLANQRTSLEARRGILADQIRQGRDIYEATRIAKIATYDRVIAELDQKAAEFDPAGTQRLNAELAKRQFQAQRDALIAKHLEERQKAAQEAAKIQLDRDRLAETKRRNDQLALDARANRAIDWTRISDARTKQKQDLEIEEKKLAATKAAKEQERADKQAQRIREFGMYGPDIVETDEAGNVKIDANGAPMIRRGPPLIQADGTQFTIENPTAAKEVRDQISSTERVIEISDEIRAIRDRVGGESKTLNSAEAQRLIVLGAELGLLKKKGTQGMSSDADFERLQEATGAGGDATKFRSITAGLEKGREVTERNLTSLLGKYGYSGPTLRFPDVHKTRAPEKTLEQERQQRLFEKPNVSIDEAERQSLEQLRDVTPKDARDGTTWTTATATEMVREARRRGEEYKDIAPDQRLELQRLGALAAGTTAAAAAARATLADVAQRGGTERIREEARAALESAQRSSTMEREPLGTSSATAAQEGAP